MKKDSKLFKILINLDIVIASITPAMWLENHSDG